MKIKINAPKKYKKEIFAFCKEYEFLAGPKTMEVTLLKKRLKIAVCWDSGNSTTITEYPHYSEDELYETKEIRDHDAKIRDFEKRTDQFGRTYFKDKTWLWKNILWNYRPENGEHIKVSEIKWE